MEEEEEKEVEEEEEEEEEVEVEVMRLQERRATTCEPQQKSYDGTLNTFQN